ncbi:MAG: HepT-like ribonuclease domain-containing protein, partial [Longimicrobiales bacterium]
DGGDAGTQRDSDLDVAVLLDTDLFPDRKSRSQLRTTLASDLTHALGGNHVDLVVLNDAPTTLGKRIVTGWPRVFCVDPDADHAFVRDIQLQAADMEIFPTRGTQSLFEVRPKPYLQHRLDDLRRHLDHLYALRAMVTNAEALEADLSLHNDVRFALLTVAQLVIDIAAEVSVRRKLPFADYSEAIRNLAALTDMDGDLLDALALLPGFRNALLHPYVALDPEQVVEHLQDLKPVEELMVLVARFLED